MIEVGVMRNEVEVCWEEGEWGENRGQAAKHNFYRQFGAVEAYGHNMRIVEGAQGKQKGRQGCCDGLEGLGTDLL